MVARLPAHHRGPVVPLAVPDAVAVAVRAALAMQWLTPQASMQPSPLSYEIDTISAACGMGWDNLLTLTIC
jgi:hypothetical protein